MRGARGSLVIKMGMLILTRERARAPKTASKTRPADGNDGRCGGTRYSPVGGGELRVIYDSVWKKKYKREWKISNKPLQLV